MIQKMGIELIAHFTLVNRLYSERPFKIQKKQRTQEEMFWIADSMSKTWISKAIVYINGEATEQEMTWHQNGDLVYGEIEVPVEEGEDAQVEVFSFVSEDEIPDEVSLIMGNEDMASESAENLYTEDTFTAELEQKEGRIFLVTDGETIDITEDFSDGEATGTFEYCGLIIKYTVTGSVEEFAIRFSGE